MNIKETNVKKIYEDADGYVFFPDPMREISLAAFMIQEFMNRARDPENLADLELKIIRHNALRVIGEVEAIQNMRGDK